MAILPEAPTNAEILSRNIETVTTTAEPIAADSPVTSTGGTGGAFNINSFRTEIKKNDILPVHSFLVVFSPFASVQGYNTPLTEFVVNNPGTLIMRCETAFLPGPTLLTENIRRYTYGPTETVPYGVQFGDITLEWIVDKKAKIFQFFDAWMHTVVNFNSKGGGNMRTLTNGYSPYEVGYKDEYTNRQMNVFVYDRQLRKTVVYTIYDVFPTQINDVNVSWKGFDEAMKLTVRFAYTDYKMDTPKLNPLLIESEPVYENLISDRFNIKENDPYGLRSSGQVSILTPDNNTSIEKTLYVGNDSGNFQSKTFSPQTVPFKFGDK
jgi:hypothetical protein